MREQVEKIGANDYLEKNAHWKPYDIDIDMDRVLVAIATVPTHLRKAEWELVKIAIDDKFKNLK